MNMQVASMLAIVNSVAVNIGMHVSFWISVVFFFFQVYILQ